MRQHQAGQHRGHIVFGANQTSCWLVCNACTTISPRVLYQHICCATYYRRPPRTQPNWEIMAGCVWIKWTRLHLRLFWMGREDTRNYFADTIEKLNQRRRFVDAVEEEEGSRDVLQEVQEDNSPCAQRPCPSKPFEGLDIRG